MKYMIAFILFITGILSGCQKEEISLATDVSETFYVNNAGASMRVMVEGNTASKVMIIIVHGGPGSTAYIYNTDYISTYLEDKYAVAYWDQRNAGASQGNDNDELVLSQYVDDLKKVIEVIKYRYGKDVNVFILGHSFGGLLTSAFLTTKNYQDMVKGWICVDGCHDYPLNDTLTRQMLLDVGTEQIKQNKHVEDWTPIIDYCNLHTGNFTLDESMQLTSYATSAETYIDSVNQINVLDIFMQFAFKDDIPLSSVLFNYLSTASSGLDEELATADFSAVMHKVKVPTLLLWGKFDFICPTGLADDIYAKISSHQKKIVVSPVSGHNVLFQDDSLFCASVANFVAETDGK
jgi:pimeloyl-ACP methyl ester carboxylesterase